MQSIYTGTPLYSSRLLFDGISLRTNSCIFFARQRYRGLDNGKLAVTAVRYVLSKTVSQFNLAHGVVILILGPYIYTQTHKYYRLVL